MLKEAAIVNNAISTNSQIENNLQQTTKILLNSLVNQNGQLSYTQVEQLKDIARQDPRMGGVAVGQSLAMLPLCEKAGIGQHIKGLVNIIPPTTSTRVQERSTIESANWLFPNPSISELYVDKKAEEFSMLLVMDIHGKTLHTQEVENDKAIIKVTKDLIPGLYFVQLRGNQGNQRIAKLVVQNQ
jgi:Secretion system C-terminal sorting domain